MAARAGREARTVAEPDPVDLRELEAVTGGRAAVLMAAVGRTAALGPAELLAAEARTAALGPEVLLELEVMHRARRV